MVSRQDVRLHLLSWILTEANTGLNLFLLADGCSDIQACYLRIEMYDSLTTGKVSGKLYTMELDVDIYGMLA